MSRNILEILYKTTYDGKGAAQARQGMDGASKSAKGGSVAFGGLAKYAGYAAAAYGAVEAASAAYGAAADGRQIRLNENRFNVLTKTIGANADMMARLQVATKNQASEAALMSGANRLMQMSLVDSADSLEEQIYLVSRLKAPNVAVGDAIKEWSALLANQSIELLDNFGISSGKVRVRIKELQSYQRQDRNYHWHQSAVDGTGESEQRADAAATCDMVMFRDL